MNCDRCGKEIIGHSLYLETFRFCTRCFLLAEKELGVNNIGVL